MMVPTGGTDGHKTNNAERDGSGDGAGTAGGSDAVRAVPEILAVGLNYKSHLGNSPTPARPEMFYKPISALQNPGDPIVIPPDATNVHYEGEMVLVIGKELRRATESEAAAGIFGVTCGNDVSERQWQNGPQKDLQWWRAKGADTFAPLGPAMWWRSISRASAC